MHTHRVLAMETRVGGKLVRRGDMVAPSEREQHAAPWAFEPIKGSPEPETPKPAGLQMFEQLMADERENAKAVDANQQARRRVAAEQHMAAAMNLLGIKSKISPLALAIRLADLFGYDQAEDGDDPFLYADAHLTECTEKVQWLEAANRDQGQELCVLRDQRRAQNLEVEDLKRRLAEAEKAAADAVAPLAQSPSETKGHARRGGQGEGAKG